MAVLYSNNASSALSAPIGTSDTSFTVTTGQGALFPTITGANYFYATLFDASGNLEIVKVTGRSSDTFTVVRAQDGSTARSFAANDSVELRITKAMLDDLKTDAVALGPNGTTQRAVYTATAGQDTFSASYTVGYVDVYLNGVKQQSGVDFTASNGTTVVFAVALAAGDVVDIVAYGTFSIASIQPRIVTVANTTFVTPNADTTDIVVQANSQAAGTLTINAPTGTPGDGQRLTIRLTSTNIQTLSWNAAFIGSTDLPLPTNSTGSSKTDYMGFIYNLTAAKWQLVAKNFGF